MKAIFDTRAESGYDDEIVERYHFPNRYLPVAQQSVGDWIIYREPRRGGGRSGYVAVARLVSIDSDPGDPGRSYARMADFLPLDTVVPLEHPGGFYEARLRAVSDRSRIGVALQGRSVRPISDEEFGAIVRAGLATTLAPENAVSLELDAAHMDRDSLRLPISADALTDLRTTSVIGTSRRYGRRSASPALPAHRAISSVGPRSRWRPGKPPAAPRDRAGR